MVQQKLNNDEGFGIKYYWEGANKSIHLVIVFDIDLSRRGSFWYTPLAKRIVIISSMFYVILNMSRQTYLFFLFALVNNGIFW